MRRYSENEVIREAQVFIRTPGGVEAVSKLLNVPRSTVHYHVAERLFDIDRELWWEVRKRIAHNKHNYYTRGGKKR